MQKTGVTSVNHRSIETGGARLKGLGVYAGLLTLGFAGPLYDLARLAFARSEYSHILLIPLVSAYLLRQGYRSLQGTLRSSWRVATVLGGVAFLLLIATYGGWIGVSSELDILSFRITAYVILLIAGGLAFLGAAAMRRILFPVLFLFFLVPLPAPVVHGIETLLQRASAEAVHLLFWISGETFLREGLRFRLPGLTIEVAQECSGIRSTLVLFIVSLLAGRAFLDTASRRVLLVLAVLPIAILRNGFRVFLIASLSVHVSPDVIHSPLHQQGGPLFFVLSLIPFLLCVWMLRRSESGRGRDAHPANPSGK